MANLLSTTVNGQLNTGNVIDLGYTVNGSISTASFRGINFHDFSDLNYYIGKPAGNWTQPLHIHFWTGIWLRSHQQFGGTRFYNLASGNQLMSVGDGGDIVNIYSGLTVNGSLINTGNLSVSGTITTQGNSVITSGNIGSQSVNYATSAGTLYREDNRTISPSELTEGYAKFGFTSWANNNSAPYADFLHLRSYTDSSGGSDNLIMFKKSGIGMRIWQQTYGSSTAYSSYVDVWTSADFSSTNVSNWNTAFSWGNHASAGYVDNTQIVPISLIQVTRTELLTLISNNELITNAHYEISEVCDYYFKGSTITLQATSGSTLNTEGTGKFYVPIYSNSTFKNIWNDIVVVYLTNISGRFYDYEPIYLSTGGQATLMANNVIFADGAAVSAGSTITGAYNGATATIQFVMASDPVYVNKVVIYGGSCWKNLTGNMGYDVSDTIGAWSGGLLLNTGDWELVSYQDTNYYKLIENKVNYNYEFDIITYMEDASGNKVYENTDSLNNIFLYGSPASALLENSNIIYFPWGDSVFTYNTISVNSAFSMLNTFISTFSFNTITGSYFSTTYSKSPYSSWPNGVILDSYIQGNTFNSCDIYGLGSYGGDISRNTFTTVYISNFHKTYINECQLKNCSISNTGYVTLFISRCQDEMNVSDNYGTGNEYVQITNCTGSLNYNSNNHINNGVNLSSNSFGIGTYISNNTFANTSISNNKFDITNIQENYFYNIKITYNSLFYTDITYNTFDASSFSGYDPQVGIVGCTNLTNNNFSFAEYKFQITRNNFQGRSGIANCIFQNSIYFTDNTFTDSKLANTLLSTNSTFTNNTITSSFLDRLNFNSFSFENNTFNAATFSDNDFTGSMRLNTVTSSNITLNRGGSRSRSVLFRCTLTGSSKIQDNTFGTAGGMEDCILDTTSSVSLNTLDGPIQNLRLSNSSVLLCTIQTGGALNLTNAGNPITGKEIIRLTSLIDDGLVAALNSSAAIFNTNHVKKLIKASGGTAKIEYFNGSGYTYTDYYNP